MTIEALLQTEAGMAVGDQVVVLLGDSIMASNPRGWGGLGVVNLAVPGATIAGIISVQLPQLLALNPAQIKLVCFMAGTNDIACLMNGTETIAQFQTSLNQLVTTILGVIPAGKVWAWSPPACGGGTTEPTVAAIQDCYSASCSPNGIEVFTLDGVFQQQSTPAENWYYTDGVHWSRYAWAYILPIADSLI